MAIVNATSREDVFTGLGGPNNTTSGDDTIIYTATNQVDNTLADPANGVVKTQDTIDGGDGFDTIQVGTGGAGVSIDFAKASQTAPITPPALFFNIEGLAFTNTSGSNSAKFMAEQFGTGLISNNLQVTGVAGSTQIVDISFFALNGGTFDASGWSFVNWTSGVDVVTIAGSAGNDTITGSIVADSIDGNGGDDLINIANGQFVAGEAINGGAGADTLSITNATTVDFSAGNLNQIETLSASAGDDKVTMTFGQWGVFTSGIDLGGGTNTLNVTASTAGTVGGGGIATPATLANIATGNLVGTSGADAVTMGGAQLDAIIIGAGTIDLGGGADTLSLTSTSGDLNLLGATDASIVGLETISTAGAAGGASVSLTGQTEGFVLIGGSGNDAFVGGTGNDTITGAGGADSIVAGGGNDVINVASGAFVSGEVIDGGSGSDAIVLVSNVTVDFSVGAVSGIESITGSAASDTVSLSAAQWSALSSIDLVGATNTLNVVASGNIAAGGTPTLANITTGNLRGTAGNDSVTMSGTQLDAVIVGGGTIDLGVGTADAINLTSTSADLNALAATNNNITGVEIISASGATAGVTIVMSGQGEAFALEGGAGGDSLVGGSGADSISGNAGNDTLVGGTGGDKLTGGAGGDAFSFAAGSSALTIAGNLTNGTVTGYDVITDFAVGSVAGVSDGIGFAGSAVAVNAAAVNGSNSVLQLHTGLVVASHKISGGIITFDDAETFAAAVPLQTTGDVAAAVQYLQNNSFGAGTTVAFTATLSGVAHTFLFIQGDAAGTNSQDQLIDLTGIAAESLTASAGVVSVHATPVVVGDTVAAVEDTPITFTAADLLGNDTNAIAFASVSSGTGGSVVLNADGTITFTPGANFNGAASFSYTATEGVLTSGSATVTVNVQAVNDAPLAVADAGSADEAGVAAGGDATGNVIGNDSDVDAGDTLAVSSTGTFTGVHGTLTINVDGSYSYVVDNADAAVDALRTSADTLTDTFKYTVKDAAGASGSANLVITIHGANDAPSAGDDTGSAIEAGTAAGTDATGNVLTNDTDVDAGDSKSVVSAGTLIGAHGTLTLNGDGTYTYVVDNADTAVDALRTNASTLTDTFGYTMQDAAGAQSTASLTITIHGANDAPSAGDDAGTAIESGIAAGQNATGSVLTNDTDVDTGDGKAVTTAGIFSGAHGTLTLNANGTYTYVVTNTDAAVNALASASDTLTDTFNYTMKDLAGATSTAQLSITIQGANDAPVIDSAATASVVENSKAVTSVNATDVDLGQTVVYSIVLPNGVNGAGADGSKFTIDAVSGALAFIAAPDFEAPSDAGKDNVYNVTVQASDGNGGTARQTLSVTVTDVVGNSPAASNAAVINGTGEQDHLIGLAGANQLAGGAAADTLDGGLGNDTLIGGAGADALIGGQGSDTASYQSAVRASLLASGTNTGEAAGDTYNGIENLTGSGGADTLTGNGGANALTGGAGNDVLDGDAGNDILNGGFGGDSLAGGAGIDTVVYQSAVTVSLSTPAVNTGAAAGDTFSGIENVTGSSAADSITGDAAGNTLNGGAGNDTLDGSGGNDLLIGGAGADSLVGGSGTDTVVYQTAVTASLGAPAGNTGDAAGDTYSGIENLTGSGFDDNLTGAFGVNVIRGGAGNDTITGGAGNDVLSGGVGTDTFVFRFGFGNDVVTDFDADPAGGQDLLDVSAMGISAANFAAHVTVTDIGADTLVTINGNAALTITLSGVADATTVTAADFKLL